eukprot:13462589-Alexandrium_andersonii.AAC.1
MCERVHVRVRASVRPPVCACVRVRASARNPPLGSSSPPQGLARPPTHLQGSRPPRPSFLGAGPWLAGAPEGLVGA